MALPEDFIRRTRLLLGDAYEAFERSLQTEALVSIRLNPGKGLVAPAEAERVPWCETGYYLPNRWAFTFDPLFHAGGYYVQEASSMFLEQVIRRYVTGPVRCLDLCAAPGGKSTHVASLLPAGSLLVSNEVIRTRSQILAENMAKWGLLHTVVINNDPAELGELRHLFDLIVADVPCSGEGMFRKDTDSTGEWSVANVQLCAARSRRIIHDIWDALRPGGLLVYSTCTYNMEEDEENVRYFVEELGATALPVPTDPAWQVTGALRYDHPVYHFFPHRTRGEGFFLAVLQKAAGDWDELPLPTKKNSKKGKRDVVPVDPTGNRLLSQLCATNPSIQPCSSASGTLGIASPEVAAFLPYLSTCRVLSAGVLLGESKGKDFVPSQALALCTALPENLFPRVELTWEEAIRYLKKEALLLPAGVEKGFLLVTYKNIPLGFVKQVGNRANNLYPQEWRIRTGYLPEERLIYPGGRS